VLQNPLQAFAAWGQPAVSAVVITTKPPVTGSSTSKGSAPSSLFDDGAAADAGAVTKFARSGTDGQNMAELPGVHYHCSAAHLNVASTTFCKAVSGGWAGSKPQADGRRYIVVQDWDETALLIILRILHLRNRQVPRTIDLETLAKLAVLVDYYDCTEAVETYTTSWIASAVSSSPVPTSYCRELILWLCISTVFRSKSEFDAASQVAVRCSNDPVLRTLNLPIPVVVTST